MSKVPAFSFVTGASRPRLRGHIHTWAFIVSLIGLVVLVVLARDRISLVGATVFGASLAAVYGVSAAYHRLARTVRAQQVMQRLDHSMIFVLIAGTYTPICLVALPRPWSIMLLAATWSLTVVGIATKVFATDWILRVSNSLYLIMGWLAIIALPVLWRSVTPTVLSLMVLGGALYTIGAIGFYLRRPDPRPDVFGYHEVWHTMTVLAGASHYVMVALVVR